MQSGGFFPTLLNLLYLSIFDKGLSLFAMQTSLLTSLLANENCELL